MLILNQVPPFSSKGWPSALPKIAHTPAYPLIGEPIAETLKVLGKVGRTPRSQVSIDLNHGDKHMRFI